MKAMPRTRVSHNSKAHQLGWLKTKKKKLFKNSSRLISTNNLQQLKKKKKNLATKFYN